ncbi:MAG: hypothetical protein AAF562_00435 [Pseudomonadota bacterium]
MSFRKIHLRKLLAAFGATEQRLVSMLRADIRAEIDKESGQGGGGDFHTPFWSDAKSYVLNGTDFDLSTKARVAANGRRKRLYPLLYNGFMDWWINKRRFTNEKIDPYPTDIKAQVIDKGLDVTIKVENFLGLSVGEGGKRFIYPYFSEHPALSDTNARLGLWLISRAFTEHHIEDFRILDVLRGDSFSTQDCQFQGDEELIFQRLYRRLLHRWDKLRAEY